MFKDEIIGLLYDRVYVVYVSGKNEWVNGLGVIDTRNLMDKDFGEKVNILNFEFEIVRPTLEDILNSMQKSAQAINIKDMGTIIFKSGIKSDSKVVEIGIGSGFLTVALLYYLSNGKLVSYDISNKSAESVLEVLKMLGLDKRWEYRIRNLEEGIEEEGLDAVFMDVPEPWLSIEKTRNSLKYGGSIVTYLPNITQVREFIMNLEKVGFKKIEVLEIIERSWIFGTNELRPENTGLLHTSFLVFGRKF